MSVYSYHTFILPLIWKNDNRHMDTFEEFTHCFENNPVWERKDPADENSFSAEDDALMFYNEYQYFYPQVRNALYGFQGNVVKTFTFCREAVQNKAHYYITKWGRTYDLLLNAIRLKVYNTGVALFILECENHGTDKHGNPQNSFADVKNINDFGRRITLPFIPASTSDYSLCAERLEIEIPGLDARFQTDFGAFIHRVSQTEDKKEAIHLNYLSDFIKSILSYNSGYSFSSGISGGAGRIHIRPAIDDRMFVACIVCDWAVTKQMVCRDSGKLPYPFEKYTALNKSLYEFLFVDPADNCTCCSADMRRQLLQQHLYPRWLDAGSIYGVAAQSLVLLFDGGAAHLINSFLTEYVKMACLCLAQRASLICLQREISELSVEIYGKKIGAGTVTQLLDLQERFSAFESQLLFREISPQEQAIEIYGMFRDSFMIEQTVENVKSQMQGLNEAVDTDFNFDLNKSVYFLTIISAVFGIAGLFSDRLPDKLEALHIFKLDGDLQVLLSSVLLCALTWLAIRFIFRRRKRAWKNASSKKR